MPSTYTSNNKIQKIATGEQSGSWGNTTNTNFDLFDTAIDGFVSVTLSGTTHTLNIPDGSAGDGRNKVLVFTGTLAATNTISVTPNTVKKHYYVQNNTTGSQNIVISQGSGSSVTVKPGYSSIVYLDGAGSSAAVKEVLTSLKLTALIEATGAVLNGSSSGSTTLQASATASGTITLPAATDTLVGKATTDTFTNKTFDTAGTGNVLRINGTQVSAVTGTGSVVLATSPTLVTPLLGTPTSGTLTNCTGLPVSTGISGLGANVATFLATPSSANLAGAVTDETGSGALVFANTPVLVTPAIGSGGFTLAGSSSGTTTIAASATASGTITIPAATDTLVGKATTDTFTNKTFDTAGTGNVLRINGTQVSAVTGSGSVVLATSPTLVTPLLGTPTSGTLTNCTGLPISTGVSGLAANVATFLATPSSANLAAALTDETGTGANVFANTPTLVTPILGTPTSGTLTNCTGLPISSGVSGLGSGVATFLATPSSANLASAVTDETGTGALVFGTSPTIATPTITTSATVPLVIGGTGTTSTLTLRSTSGVGTTGADIIFQTGNNGATEVMRLQNGGNVGIGTTPSYRLHVSGGRSVFVANSEPYSVGVGYASGPAYWIGSNSANNALVFSEGGGSEKMRIDSSGNLLVGTTSALARLTVSSGSGPAALITSSLTGTTPRSNSVFRIQSEATGRDVYMQFSDNVTNATEIGMISGSTYFCTGAAERMRIDSSGNVGIGTSSPSQKLDVVGNLLLSGQSTAEQYIKVGYGRSGNGYSYIDLVGDTTYAPGTRLIRGNTGANAISSLEHRGTGDMRIVNYEAAPICFYTSSSEKVRIDSSGNVLIGATSPAGFLTGLQVSKGATESVAESGSLLVTGPTTAHRLAIGYSNTYNAGWIQSVLNGTAPTPLLLNPNGGNVGIGTSSPESKLHIAGSAGSPSISAANQIVTVHASTNGNGQTLQIGAITTAPWSTWIQGSYSNNPGFASPISLQPAGGDVGIGTSSPSTLLHVKSSSTNNARLRIDTSSASASAYLEFAENGTVKWYQTNDYTTDRLYIVDENSNDGVYLAQNATSWTANSDARLKNVIGPILGAVEKLNSINGVLYSWKSDPKNRVYPGVLAQDVQSVLPEAVDSDVPERLGVRYTELIPLLVNAIKELKAKIDILEARN